MAIDVNNTQA
ncbi:hypothetical protein YPPY66_1003, partial [Yersinia pestis PY-66]